MGLRSMLLTVARSRPMGVVVRTVFATAPGLVPLRRVGASDTAVAVRHPRPLTPEHVLIVPRHAIPGLDRVSDADTRWLDGCLDLAARLAVGAGARPCLVINGGAWQDVRQLHGHLLPAATVPLHPRPVTTAGLRTGAAVAHPRPARRRHWVIAVPGPDQPVLVAARVARERVPAGEGYAIVVDLTSGEVHLMSGPRIR